MREETLNRLLFGLYLFVQSGAVFSTKAEGAQTSVVAMPKRKCDQARYRAVYGGI